MLFKFVSLFIICVYPTIYYIQKIIKILIYGKYERPTNISLTWLQLLHSNKTITYTGFASNSITMLLYSNDMVKLGHFIIKSGVVTNSIISSTLIIK